ncbi:MAG: LTA synthase family protein, partial [Gillisia sp.]|nr:LTA synthase family protein [Gillisia sp.]
KFQPQKVSKLVSQIDLFPTLFSLLDWDYKSNFFGQDIFEMKQEDERAFIGNYRKLGLLKENRLLILGDQKQNSFYQWDLSNNNLKTIPTDSSFFNETVSFYQVADYLYTNDGLKVSK